MPQQAITFDVGIEIHNPNSGYKQVFVTSTSIPDGSGVSADYDLGSEITMEGTGLTYKKVANNGDATDWSPNATQKDLDAINYTFSVPNVTTVQIVDSILVDSVRRVLWEVTVQNSTESAFSTFTITAMHNGTVTTDATEIPTFNICNGLDLGVIADLAVGVILTGVDISQAICLTIASSDTVTVTGIRRVS